jgi:GxxExxY protein
MTEDELSNVIIKLAMKVHTKLGAGLLESVYQECLCYELRKAGFKVEKEKPYSLVYDELKFELGFRADLVVENKVIIECKCVEALNDVHKAQLLTYLRLANCKLGLLFNFKTLQLKTGMKRVVNGL